MTFSTKNYSSFVCLQGQLNFPVYFTKGERSSIIKIENLHNSI